MSLNPASLFRYFKDCYSADHESSSIRSIFSSQLEFTRVLKGDEQILEKQERYTAFDHPKAQDVLKHLELNKLELDLYYSAMLVLGKDQASFGRESNIASPLVLVPAILKAKEEEFVVELKLEELSINFDLLRRFDLKPSLNYNDFVSEAENICSREGGIYGLKSLLEKYYTNVDTKALVDWPKLWTATNTKKELAKHKQEGQYKAIPLAAYLLLQKDKHSLSIVNDLEQFATEEKFSPALREIFDGDFKKGNPGPPWWKYNLNSDQHKALQNAFTYHNSVIVGPPGTGKSFTIANIAAAAISNQESVLIASRNKPAVEVVREVLEKEFKLRDYLIQTSGNRYRQALLARINRFLGGILSTPKVRITDHDIAQTLSKIEAIEAKYQKELDLEMRRLKLRREEISGLRQSLENLWINNSLRTYDKHLLHYLDLLEKQMILKKQVKAFAQDKIRYFRHLHRNTHRSTIKQYKKALSSSNFTELKSILEKLEYSKLLDIFPIWLVNLAELNTVLPQKQELFDLVIIDESSQVDIAQALPAIQRAKRVVIVGDPMQLRHYSFLSRHKQEQFRLKHSLEAAAFLNYRETSILDLYLEEVREQDQVSFLREHFRSSPQLISFSNKSFYNNQLEILKATPEHISGEQAEIVTVAGTRNADGTNLQEAEAIFERLQSFIQEQQDLKRTDSLGILSPFSAQVRFLKKYLQERIDFESLKKHNILIGGPYHFQGSERDIMYLSFCVDDSSHAAAFNHLNKMEVFNVSISRARSKIVLFHSLQNLSNKGSGLLVQYLHHLKQQQLEVPVSAEADEFAMEVRKFLQKKSGYQVSYEAMPIAGMVLDILLRHKDQYFFIDLIGYPGDFEAAFHLERYQALSRIGIYSIPLHYSLWNKDQAKAKTKLNMAISLISKRS